MDQHHDSPLPSSPDTELTPPLPESVAVVAIGGFARFEFHQKIQDFIINKTFTEPLPIQKFALPGLLSDRSISLCAVKGSGKTMAVCLALGQKFLTKKPETHMLFLLLSASDKAQELLASETKEFFSAIEMPFCLWDGETLPKEGVLFARFEDLDPILALNPSFHAVVCETLDLEPKAEEFLSTYQELLAKTSGQKVFLFSQSSSRVHDGVYGIVDQAEFQTVGPGELSKIDDYPQEHYLCTLTDKFSLLLGLYSEHLAHQGVGIVYANTKLVAGWLECKLNDNGIKTYLLNGDLTSDKKTQLIQKMREGETKLLISTDFAHRNLPFLGVDVVFHFDVPEEPSQYLQRVNRLDRASGKKGPSYMFVCEEYGEYVLGLKKFFGQGFTKSVWPRPELLTKVPDVSGNPFEKGFGKYPEEAQGSLSQARDGKPREIIHQKKDFKGSARPNRHLQEDQGLKRPDRHDRGDRHDRQGRPVRHDEKSFHHQKRPSSSHQHQGKKDDQRGKYGRSQVPSVQKTSEEKGFFGLMKKIVRLFVKS